MTRTWDDLLQEMGYSPQARAEILARAEALAERRRIMLWPCSIFCSAVQPWTWPGWHGTGTARSVFLPGDRRAC